MKTKKTPAAAADRPHSASVIVDVQTGLQANNARRTEVATGPTNGPIPIGELEPIAATEAALVQLFTAAETLAGVGPITSEQSYAEAHRLTMIAVNVRTSSARLAKKYAAPFREQYDKVVAEGKRIGDRARAAEELVRPLKETWEREQEQIRSAAAEAKRMREVTRIMALTTLGAVYADGVYSLAGVEVNDIDVRALPDELWEETMAYVSEACKEVIAKAKADELDALLLREEASKQLRELNQREQPAAPREAPHAGGATPPEPVMPQTVADAAQKESLKIDKVILADYLARVAIANRADNLQQPKAIALYRSLHAQIAILLDSYLTALREL